MAHKYYITGTDKGETDGGERAEERLLYREERIPGSHF